MGGAPMVEVGNPGGWPAVLQKLNLDPCGPAGILSEYDDVIGLITMKF